MVTFDSGNKLVSAAVLLVLAIAIHRYYLQKVPYREPLIAGTPVAITLRIQQIPSVSLTPSGLKDLLGKQLYTKHIRHVSIAPAATSPTSVQYQVATACFRTLPDYLLHVPDHQDGMRWSLFLPSHGEAKVMLDTNFYGFTTLYQSQSKHTVDIIAITGLNAHAFTSWKSPEAEQMWLRDWLGPYLEMQGISTRILTYGYRSLTHGSISDATIQSMAKQFLELLRSIRPHFDKHEKNGCAIICLAHSLGGIILKQALKESALDNGDRGLELHDHCTGAILFGVPNEGLSNEKFVAMTEGQPNELLMRELGINSQMLPELRRNFSTLYSRHNMRSISIYETEDSPSAVVKDGKWRRTGPLIRLVPRASAIKFVDSESASDQIAFECNHSNLVKFSSDLDPRYLTIRDRIMELAQESPQRLKNLRSGPYATVTATAYAKELAGIIPRTQVVNTRTAAQVTGSSVVSTEQEKNMEAVASPKKIKHAIPISSDSDSTFQHAIFAKEVVKYALVGVPYTLNEVKLGSLVPDKRRPNQDATGPPHKLCEDIDFVWRSQKNFTFFQNAQDQTTFRSLLIQLFSSSSKQSGDSVNELWSREGRVYELSQPIKLFHTMCRAKETRDWLLKTYDEGCTIHFVVGYRTLFDATKAEKIASGDSSSTEDGEASTGNSSERHDEKAFEIPGERIFAICFRRVHFLWSKSKDADAAYLGKDNVWIATPVRRGDGDTHAIVEVHLSDDHGASSSVLAVDGSRQEEYYIPDDEGSDGGLDDDTDGDNE